MGKIKLSELKPLTNQEKQMIENAKSLPITYDEDCPESTPEMLRQFQDAAEEQNQLRSQIKAGLDDIAAGNIRLFSEAMADVRNRFFIYCYFSIAV